MKLAVCRYFGAAFVVGAAAVLYSGALWSQTAKGEFLGIEEVVVTAQKREQSLQDVPLAVSALGVEDMQKLGIADIKDLGNALPGLQTPSFPTTTNSLGFFIRGIGNADSNILTRDNSVGLYIDGVYLGRAIGMLAELVDLERIEVLRGPQGTLYGRNTTGGAINFVSAPPSGEFSLREELEVGNFNHQKSRTIINFPIFGGLRTSLALIKSDRDGWVENEGANALAGGVYQDYYQNTQEGVRLRASYDFSDTVFADYAYDYSDMETTPPYYQYNGAVIPAAGVPGAFPKRLEDTRSPLTGERYAFYLGLNDTFSEGHSLTLNWDINEDWILKAITGARRFDSDQEQNFANSFPAGFPLSTDLGIENEQISQELQIIGSANGVQYVGGFYYLNESGSYEENQFVEREQFVLRDLDQWSFITPAGPSPIDTVPADPNTAVFLANDSGTFLVKSKLKSWALFGQFSMWLNELLELTGGLRYTEDDRDDERIVLDVGSGTLFNGNPLPFSFPAGTASGNFDKLDYSIALDYILAEDVRVYGRYATGFRSGGSSPRSGGLALGASSFGVGQYGEEELVSYELGLKSQLFDNRIRLNGAIFLSEYDDIILDFLPDINSPNLVVGVNAGEAEIEGFEIELLAVPNARLRLALSYTYLNAEITDVNTPAPPIVAVDNFELLWAPQHAYSASFDYQFDPFAFGRLDVHLDYSWQDEQFANTATAGGKIMVGDYGQFNGRVTLNGIRLQDTTVSIALWGKNLTDSDEVTYNIANTAFTYQEPRRYGVDLRLTY